jgi:hypothetical protein
MTSHALLAVVCLTGFGSIWLSDIGELIVVVFGLLLWLSVLFSLLGLGMRGMFGSRSKRMKHKRGSQRR